MQGNHLDSSDLGSYPRDISYQQQPNPTTQQTNTLDSNAFLEYQDLTGVQSLQQNLPATTTRSSTNHYG
jgi:hypothetical protein